MSATIIRPSDSRVCAALEATSQKRLDALSQRRDVHFDTLLCELERIHNILTGAPYYDYSEQCWIEG